MLVFKTGRPSVAAQGGALARHCVQFFRGPLGHCVRFFVNAQAVTLYLRGNLRSALRKALHEVRVALKGDAFLWAVGIAPGRSYLVEAE